MSKKNTSRCQNVIGWKSQCQEWTTSTCVDGQGSPGGPSNHKVYFLLLYARNRLYDPIAEDMF